MKKVLSILFVLVFLVAATAPAADMAPKPKAPQVRGSQVTQCELAQLLVQALGLRRFMSASPSCEECFAILMQNAIQPADGWSAAEDAIVTKALLARVIVQAMKLQSEVTNPDDPKAWIDYLKSIGVPIETVGETVSYVDALGEPVVENVANPRVDPLQKLHKFNPTDETHHGVDLEFVSHLITELDFSTPRPIPPKVTPD